MNELREALRQAAPLSNLLGYLNFSAGKPDSRFARSWNEASAELLRRRVDLPWLALLDVLQDELRGLQSEGSSAFKDTAQAESVLRLLRHDLLPAYRRHHVDLLRHQTDAQLFQPFFLVRCAEALLAQAGPWTETERIVAGALTQLNDFVGYRPVAVLENRTRGELYGHERHCPLPIYFREVGAAAGPYQPLVEQTLEILRDTPEPLLEEAALDFSLFDEWGVDLRAYDHLHPANRRPNYIFGEWDPHRLDNQGRHRRFVSRQVILDALAERLPAPSEAGYADRLFEAGAVLAGTVLMACSIGGRGPTSFESTATLGGLVPGIARLRDEFYRQLLAKQSGPRGERWREESKQRRQPFGFVRQQLNAFMANARAQQLQQRRLALFYADLGYLEAGRAVAEAIATPSARFSTEIQGLLAAAFQEIERGELEQAAARLPLGEELLHRGIECGALADPWNVLGFQAQFPLFQATEDSVHDPRIDELLELMERLFAVQARLYSEAAATGQTELLHTLPGRLRRLAEWWDAFATFEVGGVLRVKGGEHLDSAEQVARALELWHRRGETPADLAFWKKQLKDFSDPKSFALVAEALLRKQDFAAALGLLVSWLSRAEELPLEDGDHSFHSLALRWLVSLLDFGKTSSDGEGPWPLAARFFALLEANADELWEAPRLGETWSAASSRSQEDPYAAAYEDMTFRDSADDGQEGALAEGGPPSPGEFALDDDEDDRLGSRLRFLAMLARLWRVMARQPSLLPSGKAGRDVLRAWLDTAEDRLDKLSQLLDEVQALPMPEPSGSYDSLVEYDRRRMVKERALEGILAASLDFALAVRSLRGVLEPARTRAALADADDWQATAIQLELALNQANVERARELLPLFARQFEQEPLLYAPLDSGGLPRKILAARTAQVTLRDLVERLPRLGLLRHTFQLLRQARDMEQRRPLPGRQITEYNHLFQLGFQEVVAALVDSAETWELPAAELPLVKTLETLVRPFVLLWMEHSQTVRLSSLEALSQERSWPELERFIRAYGGELFTAKFMTLGNLRGILANGVGPYLDYLANDPEAEKAEKLLAAIEEGKLSREAAERNLTFALKAIVENYEEFKDYNSTTTQSDYGENLYRLIDFLRLKASYDRHAWNFRPYLWAQETLCRKGRHDAAALIRRDFARLTGEIARNHLDELKKLQQAHGMALRTVGDYVAEAFVKPMEHDDMAAQVEPAFAAARRGDDTAAFERLRRKIEPFAAQTSGIGLEAPNWLRRLEQELQRLQEMRAGIAAQAENLLSLPKLPLSLADIQQQMEEWDLPLDAKSR